MVPIIIAERAYSSSVRVISIKMAYMQLCSSALNYTLLLTLYASHSLFIVYFLSVANLRSIRYFSLRAFSCFARKLLRSRDSLYSAAHTTICSQQYNESSSSFYLSTQQWPFSAVSVHNTCQRSSSALPISPQTCATTRRTSMHIVDNTRMVRSPVHSSFSM